MIMTVQPTEALEVWSTIYPSIAKRLLRNLGVNKFYSEALFKRYFEFLVF